MAWSSLLKRSVQVLLCAAALSGGAGFAHVTRARPLSAAEESDATARLVARPGAPEALASTRGPSPLEFQSDMEFEHEHVEAVAPNAAQPGPDIDADADADVDAPTDVNAEGAESSHADAPRVGPRVSHDAFGERFRNGHVMTGATRHRMLLFTFDDGPELRSLPRLLDILDQVGVKAVFFVNATHFDADTRRQRAQGRLLQDIITRGHMLGNHTYHHDALTTLNNEQIARELRTNEEQIRRFVDGAPVLVRPPYGARSPRTDRVVSELGYTSVLWNIATGDTVVREPEEVLRIFKRKLRRREREHGERGGIVLMHDTHGWSVAAFPRIIEYLRQENCRLLRTDEELYDIVDDPRFFYAPIAEGEDLEMAPMAEVDPEIIEARQSVLREETRQRCEALAQR